MQQTVKKQEQKSVVLWNWKHLPSTFPYFTSQILPLKNTRQGMKYENKLTLRGAANTALFGLEVYYLFFRYFYSKAYHMTQNKECIWKLSQEHISIFLKYFIRIFILKFLMVDQPTLKKELKIDHLKKNILKDLIDQQTKNNQMQILKKFIQSYVLDLLTQRYGDLIRELKNDQYLVKAAKIYLQIKKQKEQFNFYIEKNLESIIENEQFWIHYKSPNKSITSIRNFIRFNLKALHNIKVIPRSLRENLLRKFRLDNRAYKFCIPSIDQTNFQKKSQDVIIAPFKQIQRQFIHQSLEAYLRLMKNCCMSDKMNILMEQITYICITHKKQIKQNYPNLSIKDFKFNHKCLNVVQTFHSLINDITGVNFTTHTYMQRLATLYYLGCNFIYGLKEDDLLKGLPYFYNNPENNILIDSKYYIIGENLQHQSSIYKQYLPQLIDSIHVWRVLNIFEYIRSGKYKEAEAGHYDCQHVNKLIVDQISKDSYQVNQEQLKKVLIKAYLPLQQQIQKLSQILLPGYPNNIDKHDQDQKNPKIFITPRNIQDIGQYLSLKQDSLLDKLRYTKFIHYMQHRVKLVSQIQRILGMKHTLAYLPFEKKHFLLVSLYIYQLNNKQLEIQKLKYAHKQRCPDSKRSIKQQISDLFAEGINQIKLQNIFDLFKKRLSEKIKIIKQYQDKQNGRNNKKARFLKQYNHTLQRFFKFNCFESHQQQLLPQIMKNPDEDIERAKLSLSVFLRQFLEIYQIQIQKQLSEMSFYFPLATLQVKQRLKKVCPDKQEQQLQLISQEICKYYNLRLISLVNIYSYLRMDNCLRYEYAYQPFAIIIDEQLLQFRGKMQLSYIANKKWGLEVIIKKLEQQKSQ